MARAKKVTEEVKEAEVIETPVVEDKPKTTKKKATKKTTEEPVVEEPVVAVPVVEDVKVEEPAPVVEEVKPEPVKEKKAKKVETPVEEKLVATSGKVVAVKDLYVLKVPGVLSTKMGIYKVGTKFDIIEEDKGWGKIADGKWVNLNYVEKI